jgi:hypothetical protein
MWAHHLTSFCAGMMDHLSGWLLAVSECRGTQGAAGQRLTQTGPPGGWECAGLIVSPARLPACLQPHRVERVGPRRSTLLLATGVDGQRERGMAPWCRAGPLVAAVPMLDPGWLAVEVHAVRAPWSVSLFWSRPLQDY